MYWCPGCRRTCCTVRLEDGDLEGRITRICDMESSFEAGDVWHGSYLGFIPGGSCWNLTAMPGSLKMLGSKILRFPLTDRTRRFTCPPPLSPPQVTG